MVEELVGLEEITASPVIEIVDDHDEEWIEDRSKPEVDPRATAFIRTRFDESSCARMVERNDIGPKRDQ